MTPLGLDVETYLIGARLTPRVVSVQTSDGALYTRERFGEVAAFLVGHLQGGGHIVGQNISFDLACLIVEFDELLEPVFAAYQAGQIHCTMIREQLIAIALGQFRSWRFSLNAIVERRFGVALAGKTGADVWRLRFSELDGVPSERWPESARAYAVDDASWAVRVYEVQEALKAITDTGRRVMPLPDEKEQTAAAWALHLLSIWGIAVDREAADRWVATIENDAAEHLEIARAGGFLRDNGTKDVTKIRAMVDAGYDGAPPLTDKGGIKTDRDTLLGSGNPALIAYAQGSKVQKLANTYAKVLRGVGSVHPRYNALRRSGRTSARDPNIQQAPRDGRGFRECFVPRCGYVFALCDYDQVELLALGQVLKWWCGSSAIIEAVKAGRDLHVEVAAKLAGVPYETMATRVDEGDKEAKALRQFAKVANYGFPGGLSSNSFADYAQSFGLDVSPNEAAEIRRAWMEAWPEMREYFNKIGQATRSGSSITIIQPVSERQRGGCTFTSAANSYFQGLVADMSKAALVEVSRRCFVDPSSALYGSRPCAFLHDEIIIESPEAVAPEAAAELAAVMIGAGARYLPDVPVSASPVLAARWSKEAKQVFKNGRLEVWR